jgi:hypothetical protein
MCFLGITFQYTVKVSLSVAIVAMVRKAPVNAARFPDTMERNLTVEELDVCPGSLEEETDYEVFFLAFVCV